MLTAGFDLFVVGLEQDFGPTEGVSNRLLEQPREQLAEEPVAHVVDELHRPFLHRIDEAGPVDKAAFAGGQGIKESRQVFRWHGQVGVQDHQHIAACRLETLSDGVALPQLEHHRGCVRVVLGAGVVGPRHLQDELDVLQPAVAVDDLLDALLGPVSRGPVDEDDLGLGAEIRHALDRCVDVADLIPAGNDHGALQCFRLGSLRHRLGDEHVEKVEVLECTAAAQQAIGSGCHQWDRDGDQQRMFLERDPQV